MLLTVRAVPEERVRNKEMNDYMKRKAFGLPLKDASIAQYSPCLYRRHFGCGICR